MFSLDLTIKKSIYEQVVDGFKSLIISGEMLPNDKLPSVRDLSSQLTVNPNTIAKAFKSLESQGWIYTISGRGCFVSEVKQEPDYNRAVKLYDSLRSIIRELLFMGISDEEILEKIKEVIAKEGGSK